MSKRMGESALMNGPDKIPRPFLIGVAGGTASGKVRRKYELECHASRCAKIIQVQLQLIFGHFFYLNHLAVIVLALLLLLLFLLYLDPA